ncbi:hypothetical protein [Halopenitus sp. POP-27]|uniref:hypothetical protein n=1 Tax=Halopenitus sp. POP-27 TaxID=2994425 RepID=UPI0024682EBD|nr:hypothetical protein [Halopenitus sp. POP-27]
MGDPDADGDGDSDGAPDSHADGDADGEPGTVRVWLVERTYSDDEQNMVILVYATPDGARYFRKERALTSFTDVRDTTAAIEVEPGNLGAVEDPDRRDRYATEASRMTADHDPDDVV